MQVERRTPFSAVVREVELYCEAALSISDDTHTHCTDYTIALICQIGERLDTNARLPKKI